MQLQFDTLEEVLAFADRVRPVARVLPPTPGAIAPGNIDPDALARKLRALYCPDGVAHPKIVAIQIYRATMNSTLADAKRAIDRVWD